MSKTLWGLLAIQFLCINSLWAQIPLPDTTDGVISVFVPLGAYDSDQGLIGGGVFQRINYGEELSRPFTNRLSFQALVSTKGYLSGKAEFETSRTFGQRLESRWTLEGERLIKSNFFGVGNEASFEQEQYDQGIYFFEDRQVRFDYRGRYPLYSDPDRGGLEGVLLFGLNWSSPKVKSEQSIYALQAPHGSSGGWVNLAGGGVILDRRDNRFNPSSGYRIEANLSYSGPLTASNYTFNSMMAEFRYFRSLHSRITVAQKLEFQARSGNPPFWNLANLGSENGLRGYALNRFMGDASVLYIAEVRTWMFSMWDEMVRVGGQLFFDTGRVFEQGELPKELRREWKYTWGAGGAISILNPDFILRGDIGFSGEMIRIYAGVGYLF
ncbi:MAG: BamA/TamA family outer membrane protein [Balneolaceae bacterium]